MEYEERLQEQSLLARNRSASSSTDEIYDAELERDSLDESSSSQSVTSTFRSRWWCPQRCRARHNSKAAKAAYMGFTRPRRRRLFRSQLCNLLLHIPYLLLALIVVCGMFFPSYANPPQRYNDLRRRVEQANVTGSANPNNEKVFIAASLYDKDGGLVSGDWGRSVLRLIDILGPENVFLSIYENDPDIKSQQVLNELRTRAPCNSSIAQEHLDLEQLPHIITPHGSRRIRRIAYLAEVRNRALRPLDDVTSPAYNTRWNKLIYLNDVVFDPVDAANLIFNTNFEETTGKTHYRAACAVDFINPFKFYDTYATRDLEGYGTGVPFYPWFTGAGYGESRRDVLSQTDAVRVKACWSGMVAFAAKWFQPHLYEMIVEDPVVTSPSSIDITKSVAENVNVNSHAAIEPQTTSVVNDFDEKIRIHLNSFATSEPLQEDLLQLSGLPFLPLRFRAETDQYWDASECCLIHADLSHLPLAANSGPANARSDGETGIYMNPYIRVAYSQAVLSWLPFTKRFEQLYPPVHSLMNWIGRMPRNNPRRLEQPGDEVTDSVWHWDEKSLDALKKGDNATLNGSFREVKRIAKPGQFCGSGKLSYIKHPQDGDGPWGSAYISPAD